MIFVSMEILFRTKVQFRFVVASVVHDKNVVVGRTTLTCMNFLLLYVVILKFDMAFDQINVAHYSIPKLIGCSNAGG